MLFAISAALFKASLIFSMLGASGLMGILISIAQAIKVSSGIGVFFGICGFSVF
jgi:hypothetical protein